jgi:hypothetical protein
MASELAARLLEVASARYGSVNNAKLAIDAELSEVREVLDTTKRRLLPDGPCWCRTFMPTLGHTEDCQRARALYEKLRTDK